MKTEPNYTAVKKFVMIAAHTPSERSITDSVISVYQRFGAGTGRGRKCGGRGAGQPETA